VIAAQLLYEAFRAGAPARAVASPLAETATRTDAPLVAAFAEHARARTVREADALAEVSNIFERIGTRRYAYEAAAHAASVFADQGRMDSARRLATRARTLHREGPLPQMPGVDPESVELTPREAQLIELASRGFTNHNLDTSTNLGSDCLDLGEHDSYAACR
jgi:DNA-binding NarL/FixJ family response regulator